jgi:gamma-glutamyltranspeptidase/glutathione hydrolase
MVEAEKTSTDRRQGIRHVADYFYRGPVAREIDAYCKEHGGLLRYSDLASHVTRIEDPVTIDYRGYTVNKCGFWTQGPYLLQTLKMLEGFDLKAMGHNNPDTIMAEVEAMKLALADRDIYFADPNFAHVPMKELLSPEYVSLRRSLIDLKHASLVQRPGDPEHMKPILENFDPRIGTGGEGQDTTTCLVADNQGNVIAATPSGFTGFLAGKTGVNLSSRLQQFNNWEGSPNRIEPGKRPRITLTPTLVLKDGKPVLAVSVAGGDMQDQAILQHVVNTVDFGMTPIQTARSARFGTDHLLNSFGQRPPILGSLTLSPDMPSDVVKALADRGHKVTQRRPGENSIILGIDQKTGMITAAGDPRAGRHAAAY